MKRKRILSLFAVPLVIAGTAFGWVSARNRQASAVSNLEGSLSYEFGVFENCDNNTNTCEATIYAYDFHGVPTAGTAEEYRFINGVGRWEVIKDIRGVALLGKDDSYMWTIKGAIGEDTYYRISINNANTGTQYYVFGSHSTNTSQSTYTPTTNTIVVNNQAFNIALGTKDAYDGIPITATSSYGRTITGYRFFSNGEGGSCPSEFFPVDNPGTTVTGTYNISAAGVYTIWFVDDHNEAAAVSFPSTGSQYRIDNTKLKITFGYLTETGGMPVTVESLTGRNIVGFRYFGTGSGASLPHSFNPVTNPGSTVTMAVNVPGPGTYTIWFVDEDGNATGSSFYSAGLQYKEDSSKVAIDLGIMDSDGKIEITGRSLAGRKITGYRFFSDGGGSYAPQSYEPVNVLGTSVTIEFDISTPGTYTIWFADEDHMVHGVSFNSFGVAEEDPVLYDFRAGLDSCTEEGCRVWVHGAANDDNPGGTDVIYIGSDPNNLTATTPVQNYSYYMAQPGETVYYRYAFTDTGGHQVSTDIESITIPRGDSGNPEDNTTPSSGSNTDPGNSSDSGNGSSNGNESGGNSGNSGSNNSGSSNGSGQQSSAPVGTTTSATGSTSASEELVENPNTSAKRYVFVPIIGVTAAAAFWWIAKRNYK